MHRRDFFKTILSTPLLTPLLLASKKSKNEWELYLISDDPQKYIATILKDLQKHTGIPGKSYTFLNSFPHEKDLAASLQKQGWKQGLSSMEADMTFSFSLLQRKARPSFTLVREGRIQDIRSQKLHSLWKEINRNTSPSSTLTIVSLKNRHIEYQKGHFNECEVAWSSLRKSRVYERNFEKDMKNKIHPTQKPVALYDWLLHHYAKPNDLILDTHLGSGSSRIAAYKGGFNFVGFEIDAEYYDKQNKRFNDFKSQLRMF